VSGPQVDDQLPGFTARLTRADLVAYATASGDHNPIHLDEAAARAAGLPGVVAHGMATLALAGRLLTAWAGSELVVTSLRTRFVRPVVVPAAGAVTVDVAGRVAAIAADGTVTVELAVSSGGQQVLGQTRATLLPRQSR